MGTILEILMGSILGFIALIVIGVILMVVAGCDGGSRECSMRGMDDPDSIEIIRQLNKNGSDDE